MKKAIRKFCSLLTTLILSAAICAMQNDTKNAAQKALTFNDLGVKQNDAPEYDAVVESFNQAICLQLIYATADYNLGSAFYHLGVTRRQ